MKKKDRKGLRMRQNLLLILMTVAIGLGLVFVAGCQSNAQTGALIGGLIGAGAGQAIGRDTKSTLIGAGYIIGNENDKKK